MTWILPKQLHTLACALDTEALNLDSREQSGICAQSLFVRSKVLPSRTWSQKWKRDSWTRHLSGRILRPSLGEHFATEWTSSLADILANPSAQQGSGQERTTPATSGLGLQMAFDFSDPDSASSRTSKDISAWGCATSSKTWDDWVTERRGAYSQRLKSAHRTSESASSSWPTSSARDWKGCYKTLERKDGKMRGDLLPDAVNIEEMSGPAAPDNPSTDGSRQGSSVDWRTPQASEAGAKLETLYTKDGQPARPGQRAYRKTPDGRMVLQSQTINQQVQMVAGWQAPTVSTGAHQQKDGSMIPKLDGQVKQWATPRANKTEGYSSPEFRPTLHQQVTTWPTPASSGVTGGPTGLAGGSGNREKLASMLPDAEAKAMGCGKLNPRWVETLMNLPVGWTMPSCVSPVTIAPMSCDSSETASSRPPQNGPFGS